MPVSLLLASLEELATLLKAEIPTDDPYALMMLAQASQAVRDAAGQPGWVLRTGGDPLPELPPGTSDAPLTAQHITLWVAQRAYLDPRNRSRRTSGPISESFFENGVYGLDLTEGEKARLEPLSANAGGGLWTIRTGSDQRVPPVYLADVRPGSDPILYAGPEYAWAFTPRPIL